MFETEIENLKRLSGIEVQIQAEGTYPTKQRTPVQNVAKWQNDGTETIKPSRFVERAMRRNQGWQRFVFPEMCNFLFGDTIALQRMGQIIAGDIMAFIDRIDTRRLSHSLVPKVKQLDRKDWTLE